MLVTPMKDVLISAHRGGLGDEKDDRSQWENRLDSFKTAFQHGHRSAELDLWLSKDGVPMVIHDKNLDRTHGIRLAVGDASAAELQGHGIPSLAQVLDMAENFPDKQGKLPKIFLEVKSDRTTPYTEKAKAQAVPVSAVDKKLAETVADEVTKRVKAGRWKYDDLPVIGFCHEQLYAANDRDSHIKFGLSFEPGNFDPSLKEASPMPREQLEEIINLCRNVGATSINPEFGYLGTHGDLVKAAQGRGLEVNTWTLNKPEQVKKAIEVQVDSIITDKPDMAEKAKEEVALQKERSHAKRLEIERKRAERYPTDGRRQG